MVNTPGAEPSSFGTLLKAFRQRRHLTQAYLAETIGVHRQAVIRWEQGDFLPKGKGVVLELARSLRLDSQETRQFLEASLTALAPHWYVPFPRNPFFTGREALLEALHSQLGAERAVALTHSSALHGLGGVGKTQIALEYAYRHALDYSGVFWIAAEAEEQIASSFMRIAEVLALPGYDREHQRVVAAVQRWLTMHSQWFLIWDNLEDLDLLDRFLPSARSGTLLLTTRCQTLGTHAQGLDLMPMEQEEGIVFLLRRAKILDQPASGEGGRQFAARMPAHYAAAAELVRVMDGLPLALDQAGAYVEATQCGLPAYLDLFRTRQAALLQQRGEGSRDHPASVSTTFTLAIAATIQRHPAVWDLLQVCALLAADAIPEELVREGARHWGAALETACRDPLEWDRVVASACAYSLLSRQPAERTLSIHRLVQAVLLDGMREAERAQWNQRVIAALDGVFPDMQVMTEQAVWKQCERLLPHALLCLQPRGTAEASLVLASLAYKAAQYLRVLGRYAEAEPLYHQALLIQEQALGSEHLGVASSLRGLAILHEAQGNYEQAEPLYQRALHIQEQALGSEHLEVASSMSSLGILYAQQGKYEQAETLFLRVLRTREQALGPKHPKVANCLYNLAELYREQGKYEQAEPLFAQALSLWEQALGSEHLTVTYPLNGLASLYRDQRKCEQAELFYQRALHIREQTLGPEHPEVAYSLSGLADLYTDQGKYEQAEPLYQRALGIREQAFGVEHPDVAQTLHDLAIFQQQQGRLREALSLAKRALHIRSQSLGDTHPKTVASRTLSAQLAEASATVQEGASFAQRAEGSSNYVSPVHLREKTGSTLPETRDHAPSEQAPLQAFLDACCELHPLAWCRIRDLWDAYVCWIATEQRGVPLPRRAFAAQLKARGCRGDRTSSARIWRGIRLLHKYP